MAVEVVVEGGGEVVPGQEIRLGLAVTNLGTVVDEVQLSVLGDAQPWAAVHPAVLALFPGDTGQAVVLLAPPVEGGPPAGPIALGVLARSTETNLTTVAEATVLVATAVALDVQLVPVTSYGRSRAAHTLVVRNLGNAAVPVTVEAEDPDQLLELHLEPASAEIGPGGEATFTVRLRCTPSRDAPRLPFTVTAGAPGTTATASGTFVHRRRRRALLPLALLAAALLLAVVLVARSGEDSKAVLASGSDEAGGTTTTLAGAPSPQSAPTPGSVPETGPGGEPVVTEPGAPGPSTTVAPGAKPGTPGAVTTVPVGPGAPPIPTTARRTTGGQPPVAPPASTNDGCSHDNLIAATGSFETGLSGWTVKTGSPRTVSYGQPGYAPRPADYLGSSYAYGGPGSAAGTVAILEQVASLGPCQAGVAAGGKGLNYGGWLGGYLQQGDTVQLVVFFRAGARSLTESCTLNGPTAADRGGATRMVEIGAEPCPIPPSATAVILQVRFTWDGTGVESDGSYDNAYLYVG